MAFSLMDITTLSALTKITKNNQDYVTLMMARRVINPPRCLKKYKRLVLMEYRISFLTIFATLSRGNGLRRGATRERSIADYGQASSLLKFNPCEYWPSAVSAHFFSSPNL